MLAASIVGLASVAGTAVVLLLFPVHARRQGYYRMQVGRVLYHRRKLLGIGLTALLALAGGCGGGEVAPPVTPPGGKTRGDQIKETMVKAYGKASATKPSAKKGG